MNVSLMKFLFLIAAISAVAFTLSACQSGKTTEAPQAKSSEFSTMTVEELHDALPQKDFVLINVHIPYAGQIPQTDLFIPYNEIEQNLDKLPADKDAKIVLYCRSGHMSRIAAQTLARLGYTQVIDIPGGMNAWKAAGYELLVQDQ